MHISLWHNRYRFYGGEDAMVDLENAALERRVGRVPLNELDSSDILGRGPVAKLRLAGEIAWSRTAYDRARRLLEEQTPVVSHLHNWFPLWSPSLIDAHADAGVPLVATLHNYRMGCASATLRRDGEDCTLCLGGDRGHAVKHRCYQGSGLRTRMWKACVDRAWHAGSFVRGVARYIAPSREVANQHVAMGLPERLISVIPNACADPGPSDVPSDRTAMFAGRLSPEKGVRVLLEAWQGLPGNLDVVGEGPESARIAERCAHTTTVTHRGFLGRAALDERIRATRFMVVPSVWREPFGLTAIEAMAHGRPVVASRAGGLGEIVVDGETGLLVEPGDAPALADACERLLDDHALCQQLGAGARQRYEQLYSPEAHADALMTLFEDVQASHLESRAAS